MKVAFLFVERSPSFDFVFQILGRMTLQELEETASYIRVGLWGFEEWVQHRARLSIEERVSLIHAMLVGEPGATWQLKEPYNHSRSRLAAPKNSIYVVQFDSLRRTLAQLLHKRLSDNNDYLGFTQILFRPDGVHADVFRGLRPLIKLEKGKTVVLSSELEDSGLPEEIIAWGHEKYRGLRYLSLTSSMLKRDIGTRFSTFDEGYGDDNDRKIHQALQILGDEWEVQAERTIYMMQDLAPDAVAELCMGIEVLAKPDLSPSECAHVALNLRRCLERLADAITPPLTREERQSSECRQLGEYKLRLKRYVHQQLGKTPEYSEYVDVELDDLANRIRSLYNLGNKGVHQNWARHAFAMAVMQTIMLVNDLIILRRVLKPSVLYEPAILEDDDTPSI